MSHLLSWVTRGKLAHLCFFSCAPRTVVPLLIHGTTTPCPVACRLCRQSCTYLSQVRFPCTAEIEAERPPGRRTTSRCKAGVQAPWALVETCDSACVWGRGQVRHEAEARRREGFREALMVPGTHPGPGVEPKVPITWPYSAPGMIGGEGEPLPSPSTQAALPGVSPQSGATERGHALASHKRGPEVSSSR